MHGQNHIKNGFMSLCS